MPATARKFNFTTKDLAGGQGGAYAELEVPWEGVAVMVDIEDYDKDPNEYSNGKRRQGWLAKYEIETDSGNSLPFETHLSFSADARWKIVKWYEAHGFDLPEEEGVGGIDPNDVIDTEAGVVIDFPRDKQGKPKGKYREIVDLFPLADEEFEDGDELEESSAEPTAAEEPDVL